VDGFGAAVPAYCCFEGVPSFKGIVGLMVKIIKER